MSTDKAGISPKANRELKSLEHVETPSGHSIFDLQRLPEHRTRSAKKQKRKEPETQDPLDTQKHSEDAPSTSPVAHKSPATQELPPASPGGSYLMEPITSPGSSPKLAATSTRLKTPTDNNIEMSGPTVEERDQEIMQNKIINEEYKIWKKNSVFLYDLMYTRALDWPALTTQWLPDVHDDSTKGYRRHRMLLGTHTSGSSVDYLQIAHMLLPTRTQMTPKDYDPSKSELGGHGAASKPLTFSVVQRITHPGEVNKARYQPQNPDLIATWAPNSNLYLWDRTKHSSVPNPDNIPKPQAILKGHTKEGFAVEWNPFTEGQLISGGEDATVRLWNLESDYSKENTTISAARVFTQHSAYVNDVQWHPKHGKNFFGSVSDDLTMCFMDLRSKDEGRPAIKFGRDAKNAHTDAINSLSFHPWEDKLFCTGSADKTVGVFDIRFPEHGKIHSLEGHKDVITKVEWHPTEASVIASSSNDRRVVFWDLAGCGAEQTPEDAEDGPPEMLFMHGGHTNRVSDFSWNKNEPWVMCSTSEDNLIEIWRASRRLVDKPSARVKRKEVSD